MESDISNQGIINLNVGVLGHVDSGKTSLARVLSGIAGTAAFDKNPQSQERGITIDLGFSAFLVDLPEHLNNESVSFSKLQFTFVDCPGHASLIRTIIGGAQIIDVIILVVDIVKGMQTQTAECLVIGELTCKRLIVVLNKIDMVPSEKREASIQKMKKKISLTMANTAFDKCPIIAIAADPSSSEESISQPVGITELVEKLKELAFIPERDSQKPFVFAVDHCFSLKGQGTVMTGTVLQGAVKVNDIVEIPIIRLSKKVKSMQMFRRPVQLAEKGDRLGLCVTQFDPQQLERGLVCSPGYIKTLWAGVVCINRIKYFKGQIRTNEKFHISIGHETVMASLTLFKSSLNNVPIEFNFDEDFEAVDMLTENHNNQFALLKFEKPVLALPNTLIIGSRLDMDIHTQACRLAFWGYIKKEIPEKNYEDTVLPLLKIHKMKNRQGVIERIARNDQVIVKNLIKKETNAQVFVGLKVQLSTGEEGIIESTFGKSGKLNVHIPGGLQEETLARYNSKQKSNADGPVLVTLTFKRYIFDKQKKMLQT